MPTRPDIDLRREQVASLALVGVSQRQIADRLGVSLGTVNRDLKAVRRQWREDAKQNVAELVGREGASLDRLERDLWVEFVSTGDVDQKVRLAATILRIKERRARLFGLDAPERVELMTEDSVIVIDLGMLG